MAAIFSVKCASILNISELVEFFLLQEHASLRRFSWHLFREHPIDISDVELIRYSGYEGCFDLPGVHFFPVNPIEKDVTLDVVHAT